jgi:hypothetical protein
MNILRVVYIVVIIMMLSSCSVHLYDKQEELKESKNGVESSILNLPKSTNFSVLQKQDMQSLSEDKTCVYATSTLMIGSSLVASDALEEYSNLLKKEGWVIDVDSISSMVSRVFTRGIHERLNIFVHEPPLWLKSQFNYQDEIKKNTSIMFMFISYIDPKESEC